MLSISIIYSFTYNLDNINLKSHQSIIIIVFIIKLISIIIIFNHDLRLPKQFATPLTDSLAPQLALQATDTCQLIDVYSLN